MKKILLASTMLVSVAGYAAADVAVSGSARMGVVATDGASTFSSRVRMNFSGSGTTDGGLAFGGSFAAQDTQGANAGTAGSVFISGAFGKIAMGGVDSGDAAAVGQLASVGYTGLGSTNSINYAADGFDMFGLVEQLDGATFSSGYASYYATIGASTSDAGGSKVLYTYSAGDLTLNASTSQISNDGSHASYGLGASYTTGGLTLAAGYGSNEFDVALVNVAGPLPFSFHADGEVTDVSASATYVVGATTIKGIYQDKQADASGSYGGPGEDLSASATSMGLSVSHTIDALTLTAFGVTTELTDGITGNLGSGDGEESLSLNRYGVGVSYNLGGGASLKAGAVNVEVPNVHANGTGVSVDSSSYSAYDIGVNFSF